MTLLSRLFRTRSAAQPSAAYPSDAPIVCGHDAAKPAQNCPASLTDGPTYTEDVSDVLQIAEVTNAEFFVGDLFRRRFHGDPPDYPRHFVALYRVERHTYWPVGYIHYSAFEDSLLCGGMVIDDRLYRRIPLPARKLIRERGGIAEFMLRSTFRILADAHSIWGHVGDKQSEQVNLRVGFVRTRHPHVMVVWNRELPEEEKQARLERIIALGPF